MGVVATIKARHSTHGDFSEQSKFCMQLCELFISHPGWPLLDPEHKHALLMICVKMSRLMSGNPNVADHWHDIAGYAALVENKINDPHDLFDFADNASDR